MSKIRANILNWLASTNVIYPFKRTMLNIETQEKKTISPSRSKYLIVNGIEDKNSFFSEYEAEIEKPYSYAHFYNDEAISILTNHSFSEVSQFFNNISFSVDVEWWNESIAIDIYCNSEYGQKVPAIKADIQIKQWEHWAKPWSIATVAQEFERTVTELANQNIVYFQEDKESVLNGFGIEYLASSDALTIDNELNYILGILKVLVDKTNKALLSFVDNETVLAYFQFPKEIKVACTQYLVYFAQFIADIGISVDTELKEVLNYTLFKVTPKDKTESLDKIREALNVYLDAPGDSSFHSQALNQNDISIKQWEANIYHLKSQLALATSIIQAKDSTIEMLQLSNYQYKQLVESQNAKKDSEKEDIIGGIVAVKKYEGKGIVINLPEIFRRLKRFINK